MDKVTREQIEEEFDMVTQYLDKNLFPIDIEQLKSAVNVDGHSNFYYVNIYRQLMKLLIKEIQLQNKNLHKESVLLSDEEKEFLKSVYI